ncbi:hypothetical protein J21TS3_14740 [Paenibacillus cookii]|uniref:Uncharacterized protein n=1 Tax=Paenibacillus cookii TaxID=157839 RepID=A0ABQ4LU65_9BACL|nr:hypothetical protein J21TS3_14740 [Paenibacillus cookii]
MSRKSNGLFDTLFFIWGIISFKIKIDLKRSENPTSVTDEAILNPLQKNRGFLDSLGHSIRECPSNPNILAYRYTFKICACS